MKKLLSKVKRRGSAAEAPAARITNDTVAAHREQILAGGRKFKYPIQYARHRLVINTIIISFAALVLVVAFVWWQLYIVQSTNTIFYRLTTVIPAPVAKIDGETVEFQDYLLKYRSALHFKERYEQVNYTTDAGKRQSDYDKVTSINEALMDSYAQKLARERGITVSDDEVNDRIARHREYRDGTISEDAYGPIIYDFYGWSMADYMHDTKRGLLREKVTFAVDDQATARTNQIIERMKTSNASLEEIAKSVAGSDPTSVQYGKASGVAPKGEDDGQAEVAMTLEVGEVAKPIMSYAGDAYYVVRTLGKTESTVSYEYARVTLREFATRFEATKKSTAEYYITLPKLDNQ